MYSTTSSPAPHHVVAPTRVNAPVPTLGVRWSGGTERAAAKLGHGAMMAHVKVCAMQLWARRMHMQMKIIWGMRAPRPAHPKIQTLALCKKKILRHIKLAVHAWSTKC